MVRREAGHVLLERDLTGGGEDSGLSHAAAQHLAPAPRLANQLGGPAEQGADRGAKALGKAEGDAVDVPRDLLHVHVLLDRRVEDAGAVEVQAEAVLAGELPGPCEVVERQHLARAGVLQAQEAGAREVIVVGGLERLRDPVEVQGAVGLEVDGLRLNATQHCRASALELEGVGFVAGHVLVTSLAVGEHPEEVALGAA